MVRRDHRAGHARGIWTDDKRAEKSRRPCSAGLLAVRRSTDLDFFPTLVGPDSASAHMVGTAVPAMPDASGRRPASSSRPPGAPRRGVSHRSNKPPRHHLRRRPESLGSGDIAFPPEKNAPPQNRQTSPGCSAALAPQRGAKHELRPTRTARPAGELARSTRKGQGFGHLGRVLRFRSQAPDMSRIGRCRQRSPGGVRHGCLVQ